MQKNQQGLGCLPGAGERHSTRDKGADVHPSQGPLHPRQILVNTHFLVR